MEIKNIFFFMKDREDLLNHFYGPWNPGFLNIISYKCSIISVCVDKPSWSYFLDKCCQGVLVSLSSHFAVNLWNIREIPFAYNKT